MNLDERFLFKSTESLHPTAQEQTAQLQEQTKQMQEHTKQLQLDAENIRGLVRIAEIHERRL